jgi:hypothetical protein
MATRTTGFGASTPSTAASCVATDALACLVFGSGCVRSCDSGCVFGRVFGRVLGRELLISHGFHCLAGSDTGSYWLCLVALTDLWTFKP